MADTRLSYDKDQVRERIDLLALVGQYVALKKRGGRYTGLCPFHQEKSPSFGVDPDKGFWHCFGCGKGGDAFNFLMEMEHLSFPEALEQLAERAGVRPIDNAEAPRRKEERDFLFEVNAATAQAFRKALVGPAGAQARAYLEKRGITAEHAERFGLGYAPAMRQALLNHLLGRKFSLEKMQLADLVRSNERGNYDRFRNRLMIPIHDRRGRVVAFGGRALSPDDQPKYLNTGDTPIFLKGRTLYALHLAMDGMKKTGRAIITEGYFDVIACHLAGFTESVATLGTALSDDHVKELRRFAERIYLVFDADSAGVNAALRGQAMFRAAGVDVRIVRLPSGHDPDTLIREGGAPAFEECLKNALAPVAFELERLMQQHPDRDTESRLRLFRAAAAVLQPLPRLERAEYAEWLIDRWQGSAHGDTSMLQQAILSEVAALERSGRYKTQTPRPEQPSSEAQPPPQEVVIDRLEREVMAAIIQRGEFAVRATQFLPADAFTFSPYKLIFQAITEQVNREGKMTLTRLGVEDENTASHIAALALMEPFLGVAGSTEESLKQLLNRYEMRNIKPKEIPLANREEAEEFTRKLREQSTRREKKIFGNDA